MKLLAVLPDDIRPTGSSHAVSGEFSFVAETLEAARRLVGAKSASLLAANPASGSFYVVAGSRAAVSTVLWREQTQALIASAHEVGHSSRRVRWAAGDGGGLANTALVPLACQDRQDLFLILEGGIKGGPNSLSWSAKIEDMAVLVQSRIDSETQRCRDIARLSAASLALSHVECGIIAVNADHKIVLTNAAANLILAEENGLSLRHGFARPTSRTEAVRFHHALTDVIETEQAHAKLGSLILLSRRHRERPLLAVIAPAATREPLRTDMTVAAIIYVLRPDRTSGRGLDGLCQLHSLSSAETKLTKHLYAGLTLSEAAAEMRIKTETARAYLKQVFAKVGVNRQADLVTLLGRYMRAVRGDFDYKPA